MTLKLRFRIMNFKTTTMIFSSLIFLCVIYCVYPLRHPKLHKIPPPKDYAWRQVENSVFAKLHDKPETAPGWLLSNITCSSFSKTPVARGDIKTSEFSSFDHLETPEVTSRVLKQGHGQYMPALNISQKSDILYLYKVAASALDSVDAVHFLVDGSLLGSTRHGGFVPWDDDLDIAVHLDSWSEVEETLSCIEGFTLYKSETFIWKFHYENIKYPFIDIFFYRMDESYVWAASLYIRKTFIYPTRMVFPLAETIFEGVMVPVPKDALHLSRRIYEYDVCSIHHGHTQRNMSLLEAYPEGYSVTMVPCKDLSYMYTFFNLEG